MIDDILPIPGWCREQVLSSLWDKNRHLFPCSFQEGGSFSWWAAPLLKKEFN